MSSAQLKSRSGTRGSAEAFVVMSQQPTLAPCSMPLPPLHHGTEHSGTLQESPCMHISVSPSWLLREPHLQYSSLLHKSLDGLLGDSGHEVRVLWQVLQGLSQSNPNYFSRILPENISPIRLSCWSPFSPFPNGMILLPVSLPYSILCCCDCCPVYLLSTS